MKWSSKEVASVLLIVAVIAVGTFSGASKVYAQEKGADLAQQIPPHPVVAERTTSPGNGQSSLQANRKTLEGFNTAVLKLQNDTIHTIRQLRHI